MADRQSSRGKVWRHGLGLCSQMGRNQGELNPPSARVAGPPAGGAAGSGSGYGPAIGRRWSGAEEDGALSGALTRVEADLTAPIVRPAAPPANRSQPTPGRHDQARRLIAAANELLALAAELDQGHAAPPAEPALPGLELPPADADRWLRHARLAYRRRRSRSHFFEDALFGEPAWDLLLDLFIAAKEGKRVPVTSACIGAAVPTTTALRWLAILEERGLILREADQADARRVFVRLTAEAYARMVAYFARSAAGDQDDGSEHGRVR